MIGQSPTKEDKSHLVCLNPPQSTLLNLNGLKRPILVLILIIMLIMPLFPIFEEPNQNYALFGFTNSEPSDYIPSKTCESQLIETRDNGYAILSIKKGFEDATSFHLVKINASGGIQWQRTYGGFTGGGILVETNDGGFAIAGPITPTNFLSAKLLNEFFLIKLSNTGVLIENQTYYHQPNHNLIEVFALFSTSDSGVIIAINIHQQVDDVYSTTSDIRLLKINNEGVIDWDKQIHNPGLDIGGCILIQTNDGGFAYSVSNSPMVWLRKIAANGTIEWSNTFDVHLNIGLQSLHQTSDGGFVLSINSGMKCFTLIASDSNGNKQWEKSYDFKELLNLGSLSVGYTRTFITADNTLITMIRGNFPDQGGENILFEITIDGTILWTNRIGERWINDVIQRNDGNYVIAGDEATAFIMILDPNGNILNESLFYGPNTDEWVSQIIPTSEGGFLLSGYTTTVGRGKIDTILLKCSSDGELKWNFTFGGVGDDCLTSVIETSDGGYAFAGVTDPFTKERLINNNTTGWLSKISSEGEIQWNTTYSEMAWIGGILETTDEGYVIIGFTVNEALFILKTEINGVKEWTKTYQIEDSRGEHMIGMRCSCIIQSTDNEFIVGLSSTGSSIHVLKLDHLGNLVWNNSYRNSVYTEDFYAIDTLTEVSDGYEILGRSHFHCGHGHSTGDVPFVFKINKNGSPLWNRSIEPVRFNFMSGIDNLLCMGSWNRNYNSLEEQLLGRQISGIATPDHHYILGFGNWLLKANETGIIEWDHFYNGKIFSICKLGDESFILAGCVTIDDLNRGSYRDIWVAKTDSNGSLLWEEVFQLTRGDIGSKYHFTIDKFVYETQPKVIPFISSIQFLFSLIIVTYLQIRKKRLRNP